MTELPKQFNFKECDKKWCDHFATSGDYSPKPSDKKPYTIVIPPPNVTGILHMGHALNNTLQDIIIRYKRMQGFETLWMCGTDHAGIATQNVVEKKLAKEGKTRHDVGREKMVEHMWEWKKEYGDTILNQLKYIGASCDWSRTRFTMDDGYSEAVRDVFIHLYEKGLVYQGQRIINWCPRCQTALSDEEAEHEDVQGTLTHIKYLFKDDPEQFVIVATTRPETMLGDTAVAVNPDDERYKDLIGKTIVLPIVGREIPIIADDYVDKDFGSGAVKITPAHDPNDFAMGERHNLEKINVMHPDGTMNELAGEFEGQDRFEARKNLVAKLTDLGLIEKIDNHDHAVGHCYRCHTVVEPYLSKQWFVKMEPLAKPAIDAVKDGRIKFHPARWENTYMHWMEGIRDWCISRQIWWGHRIPVWYDSDQNIFVAKSEEEAHAKAREFHGKDVELIQDEDVLDTWFSSWLWPFATLGWPEKTDDLKFFYPGDALFTANEIIFFWVARMIMAGFEFMGDIPFKDVYIHGTVRDAQGRKMSKSLGNSLDPLEIIDEYGTDALRFSLILNSGTDVYISKDKFEIGRNFANKVWNATRLILMNVDDVRDDIDLNELMKSSDLDLASKWIISKFYSTLEKVNEAIEIYRYSEAESLVFDFFKGQFCDWYLEIIKDNWKDSNIQKIVSTILVNSLKILHPLMPVVTEEIWAHLFEDKGVLCQQSWPESEQSCIDEKIEKDMQILIDLVVGIRNVRAQWKIKPNENVECYFDSDDVNLVDLVAKNESFLKRLCRLKKIEASNSLSEMTNIAVCVVANIKCALPLGDLIDIQAEKDRIGKEISKNEKTFLSLKKRLTNEDFLKNAPENVILKEKERLESLESQARELHSMQMTLQ